jgi:hypothetical protein
MVQPGYCGRLLHTVTVRIAWVEKGKWTNLVPTMKARLIRESEVNRKAVLSPTAGPAVTGDGGLDIVCGACGTTLMQHVQPALALREMVIRCPACKRCNDTEWLRLDNRRM